MPETVAAYWESKIRIYGFREKTGLMLLSFVLPLGHMENWGTRLEDLAQECGSFALTFLRQLDQKSAQFCVVLEEKQDTLCHKRIKEVIKNETEISLTLDFPVEMISFHGPHFQDRYGIAHAAFAALESGDMPMLAAGCAGTNVCILVPENCAQKAIRLLAQTFIVPKSVADDDQR